MEFKRCSSCGCLCQSTIEKCPECGNSSFNFIQNTNVESYKNYDNEAVEPGGSVALGFVLGFFLGMFGFLLSMICGQKENGKTMMGVLYGVLANAALIFIFIFIMS